jgi:hypothetical protein
MIGGTKSGATNGRAGGLGVARSGGSPSGGQRNLSRSLGSAAAARRARSPEPPATNPSLRTSLRRIIGTSEERLVDCWLLERPES